MQWQDIIFSIGSWIFTIALIPSILGKDKPAISSSLITGLVLTVYVIAYGSLNFWLSSVSVGSAALAWFILAYQKYRIIKKKNIIAIKIVAILILKILCKILTVISINGNLILEL